MIIIVLLSRLTVSIYIKPIRGKKRKTDQILPRNDSYMMVAMILRYQSILTKKTQAA